LAQDHKNLGFAISGQLHSKSPRSSCRENSTSAAPYFRGGLPPHFPAKQIDSANVTGPHQTRQTPPQAWAFTLPTGGALSVRPLS